MGYLRMYGESTRIFTRHIWHSISIRGIEPPRTPLAGGPTYGTPGASLVLLLWNLRHHDLAL